MSREVKESGDTFNPLDVQIDGNHYKNGIQPVEYIHSNNISFCAGNAIKYLTRYKLKGAPITDLKKAIHFIQIELELSYNVKSSVEYGE